MPSILFIHENFPAQFGGIAQYLAKNGWRVVFATAASQVPYDQSNHKLLPGVRVVRYRRAREPSGTIHPYLLGSEKAVLNAQGFFRLGAALKKKGFEPDVVVAHSGWGSGSLVKVVWPETRLIQYLEWWYNIDAPDVEPETKQRNPANFAAQTLCRNLPFLLDGQSSDAILVPTHFQASQLPDDIRKKTTVLHDGIDSSFYRPSVPTDASFSIGGLPDDARIITYATRGMEPMRGFPQFMEAWQKIQDDWPNVHCVIAGTDRVCYGSKARSGKSFKEEALHQLNLDQTRLHFVGLLPKTRYRALLQRSAVHTYLTRPFVLSWSLIETMMTGTPIVASNTAPVLEVMPIGSKSLVEMDSPDQIAAAIGETLNRPDEAQERAALLRKHATNNYSSAIIWPQIMAFLSECVSQQTKP
jgi:glycosyltransferase involved in cell wall biosynthesis